MFCHLFGAVIAPAAMADPGLLPPDWHISSTVGRGQIAEPDSALAVHRQQIGK